MLLIRKKNNDHIKVNQYKQIEYLTFPLLEQAGMVRHLFSTRVGGVSEGIYASMNLSYARGDKKEAVDENFRRIAEIFQTTPDHIVCSKQTHTTNIRRVTMQDMGKGVTRPLDYDEIDGLVTNEPGIILCTSYADCVPLYFVDPENQAIGLAHSGWRGTVNRMGAVMVRTMQEIFGSKPQELLAAIGPSICQECYEIGEEVAENFRESFPGEWQYLLKDGKEAGKYQLDLWEANRRILLNAGVLPEHLAVTDVCTCCNKEVLFSHRASNGKRGNLAAFLELRKS
ncbi:MAG: peptidoglycan editing factor PgeF [Firmicutes bacterium]|nr:peptidoglycan editing factor PgeF [Bacillota bacterium]